jgi:predicted MFS family arabinose efflux permease
MTTSDTQRPDADAGGSARSGWAAVLAVTLGIFSLVTSELLPVGLLTPIASTLDVSEGTAGLMVTIPGLLAAISAPVITVAAARVDRRTLLATLTALMTVANLVCALVPDFTAVLAARVALGISVGGFWAVAGGLAVRLVPARHVGRATAIVFGGISTASVIGVPVGTLIGDLVGWRTAFALVAALGAVALICLLTLVRSLPPVKAATFGELPALLRGNKGVRIGLAITFLLVTGHFTAYTFVRPVLQEGAGIDGHLIGALLLAYGVAGVIGNFVAGARVSRNVRGTLLVIAVALAVLMTLLALPGHGPLTGTALLVAWGLAYGAVSVSLQTWMLKAAPQAGETSSALFVAAFNLSIALGALIGGLTTDGLGSTAVLWVAGAFVLLAALTITAARKTKLS